MSDTRDSSEDEENENQTEEEEDDDKHHELIPPFVPKQTVFTCHVEQPRSPKSSYNVIPQSQAKKTERFFEAVIRQARHHANDSSWEFKIHFKGWNARYDRWLPASQLLADTPEIRAQYAKQQQKEKVQRAKEDEAKKQEQARKKQQKKDQQAQQQRATAEFTGATLPFTLKTILVEEREKITRRGYDNLYGYDYDMKPIEEGSSQVAAVRAKGPARAVHELPAAVTIRQLLKYFQKKSLKDWQQKQQDKKGATDDNNNSETEEEKEARTNQFKQELKQFCKGLGRLFETALPVCLLYPQERPQYQYHVVTKHSKSVLDVYGCEFLLRLLLRLPQLMPNNTTNKKAPLVGELTILLQQNRTACFKGKFRPPTYPHEWLGWEKKYFGDPNKKVKEEKKEGSSGEGEDLFAE